MKFAVCFLAVVSCAAALPAEVDFETPDELDLSKLIPLDIYLEPINPVNVEDFPESRIIGGSEVTPNSFPYQVAVIINGNSFCGGSLISTTHVLSAAHCTISASFVQVRLGAHNFNINEATQVRVTSTNIINHPSYGIATFYAGDISIILLPSAVSLSPNIQVVSLAPASSGTFEGSTAVLTGWGTTTDDSIVVSVVLRSVNLDVISSAACADVFGRIVLASNICTSGVGTVGACSGDTGGPLVVNGLQVGIVSFGSARCEAENPTVYTRISSFRFWILENAGV